MLSSAQILALAPDASAAKAGQGLSAASHWQGLGRNEAAGWGLCKGSGAQPYQVRASWSDGVTQCSCPSRKIPCKHALGLLLLASRNPDALAVGDPPDYAAAWLAKREAKASAPHQSTAISVDPRAAAKRAAARDRRQEEGTAELIRWLRDLASDGLTAQSLTTLDPWEQRARRLNDAQLPGVAQRLREAGRRALSGSGDLGRTVLDLGSLHALLSAARRRSAWDPHQQADLDAALGVPQREQDIPLEMAVADVWLCRGESIDHDERIGVKRSWLQGARTGRWALVLGFSVGSKPFPPGPLPGNSYDVSLGFHPSADPLRAALKGSGWTRSEDPETVPEACSVPSVRRLVAERWGKNPWAERLPLVVVGRWGQDASGHWWIADESGEALPVNPSADAGAALAVSGGHEARWFGEWDGYDLRLLRGWYERESGVTGRSLCSAV